MNKKLRVSLVPALLAFTVTSIATAAAPTYSVVDKVPGKDGDYDYVSVDSEQQRAFVGREDGVMVVDLKTRKVTPKFVSGAGVHAVLMIPNSPLMLSTNGGAVKATLFNRNTGAIEGEIKVGKNPDAAIFEPFSGLVFVMNGDSNDVTLVSLKEKKAIATIPVGGKPEAAVSDGAGRVYLNVEDTAEVVVIDVKARKVASRYKMQNCEEPTGIALDPKTGLLISACGNGVAKLIDAASGKPHGDVKIGEGADGAIFDSKRRLVFIPCYAGTLTVVSLDTAGKATVLQEVKTQEGARTAALDATNGRCTCPLHRS